RSAGHHRAQARRPGDREARPGQPAHDHRRAARHLRPSGGARARPRRRARGIDQRLERPPDAARIGAEAARRARAARQSMRGARPAEQGARSAAAAAPRRQPGPTGETMKRRAPTGSSKRRSGGSRGRAATRVAARPASEPMPIEDLQRLNHEPRVYQTELESQTKALRQTQVELERTRDQYIDLYQLAPIGYMTLDPAGVILDANLAAANLLGLPHTRLVGRRLGSFATRRDEPALARHLVDTFKTGI